MKIEDQAAAFLGEAHVCNELRFEYGRDHTHAFDFDDDLILDQQVQVISAERLTFVIGGHSDLT